MGSVVSSPVGELAVATGVEQLVGQRKVKTSQNLEANWEAIGVMTRAFNGTPETAPEGTTDWILGPTLREQWDHPGRRAVIEWLMKVEWSWCLVSGGFALGARKPDGTLGAVVLVSPYQKTGIPGDITDALEFVRALRPIGMPPSKKVGKAYKRMRARGFAAKDAIGEVKKRHCNCPHAHVRVMAVDPDAQGLGLCGKVMRVVNMWADDLRLALWLETYGTRNVAIYERFGYKTMEHFALKYKDDPVHEDAFGMMRLPVKEV
ncbi:unnamed protein product [Effrenium voratum]|uniref:N-acetyltransferase domain-containing protein n=1 Tax=Effrenium voratum TaxID=2562239 RepID=A0AA36N9E6_9DINO|nr:unnamed protein product [Effrenium voratum]